ncbi:MAG: TonB family protein [Candidatus Sulfotelmatobacter sp.]
MKLRIHFSGRDIPSPSRLPLRAALGIGLALLAFQLSSHGQQNASEDQVKAAYLLNFAKLGEWPHRALPDGPSSFVIGVSGADDDFLDVLRAVAAGKTIGTHPVQVTRVNSEEDAKSCHIVFFRAPEKKHALADVGGLAQPGLLLVGEDESFLWQGGMINLVREHGNIHFEINSDALDGSEIHFSEKILALGKAGDRSASTTAANPPVEGSRRVERTVLPDYPEIAERMKLIGTAQVSVLVKRDGTVKEVRILGGHPLLADALVRAVKQWKYESGSKETTEVVKYSFAPP